MTLHMIMKRPVYREAWYCSAIHLRTPLIIVGQICEGVHLCGCQQKETGSDGGALGEPDDRKSLKVSLSVKGTVAVW